MMQVRNTALWMSWLVLVFLAACAHPTFTNYEGVTLSDGEVAIITESFSCQFCVRRIQNEDQTLVFELDPEGPSPKGFKLTPGRYIVTYVMHAHNIPRVVRNDTVDFKAGHAYLVDSDWCYLTSLGGGCMTHAPYTQTGWIEDKTTGEVVAGEKWYWGPSDERNNPPAPTETGIEYYEPPSGSEVATIVGEDSSVYLEFVDYKPVRDVGGEGITPLPLRPGVLSVVVAQHRGAFYGSTSVRLEARPKARYRIRYQQDLEGTSIWSRLFQDGGPMFFWIEDADTGVPITGREKAYLTKKTSR